MKVKAPEVKWWKKLLLIELFEGMFVTVKYQFRPHTTWEYPKEREELPERFRGMIRVNLDKCICCQLCAKACPAECFHIESEKAPEEDKRKLRPKVFTLNIDRCIFCGLCVAPCPTKAVYHSHDFELAGYDRSKFLVDMEALGKGLEIKKYKT